MTETTTYPFWGKRKNKLHINTIKFLEYINKLGFFIRIINQETRSFDIVKVRGYKVKKASAMDIRKSINAKLKRELETEVHEYLNTKPVFFSEGFLSSLPEIEKDFLKDTKDFCYIPQKKFIYKISKNNVEKIQYKELDKLVWVDQIPENEFNYCKESNFNESDFYKFLEKVAGEKNFQALLNLIGYNLHSFKDPTIPKWTVIYNENLDQNKGETRGGSGKSLICESLRYIRKKDTITGRNLKDKSRFTMQQVRKDSQIVVIEEWQKRQNLDDYFNQVTGDFVIERKYSKGPEIRKFEDAPKVIIVSNYMTYGISDSHKRRFYRFPVTNYFNAGHTPKKEFGRPFFGDNWGAEDWNNFFCTMVYCIQSYLNSGLLHVDESKALIAQTNISEAAKFYWFDEEHFQDFLDQGFIFNKEAHKNLLTFNGLTMRDYNFSRFDNDFRKICKAQDIEYTTQGPRGKRQYILTKK